MRTAERFSLQELRVRQLKGPIRMVVLGDAECEDMIAPLRLVGCDITLKPVIRFSTSALRALAESKDILIFDISTRPQRIISEISALIAAIGIGSVRPRVLCYSTLHRNPDFISAVQKCGARYARVSNPAMLFEAIELLLWEMDELEHNGPHFRITHRYSQGLCGPGEELYGVELLHESNAFQLPIGLTERILFEVLARHQRVALDSAQIVSTISAEWFFRDHAANSGHRQVRKVRRPTVKVSTQRIRGALAFAFGNARMALDPYDVLRSCVASNSNRVLYRLHGHIEWHHPPVR